MANDAANRTWAMQLIRSRSTYNARVAGSKPSNRSPIHGASRKIARLASVMTPIAPVRTVCPNRFAAPSSSRRRVV